MHHHAVAMRSWSRLAPLVGAITLVLAGLVLVPASASSVTSAAFSGGTGTLTSGGTLYAKQGGALTLTATTSNDTQCVDVSGALTDHKTSSAKSTWTFGFTAGSGDGSQTVTVSA